MENTIENEVDYPQENAGHVPVWPAYQERSNPLRTLAYERAGEITTEHGDVFHWKEWEELQECIEANNLLVLSHSLIDITPAAIERDNVRIMCSKDGTKINTISIRLGRKIRHITSAHVWECYSVSDLNRVRRFLKLMEVGDRTSPSATGAALQSKVHFQYNLPRHRLPSRACQRKIQRFKQPARTQTFSAPGWHSEKAWEFDLKNAYATHYSLHPTGTTFTIIKRGCKNPAYLATWFQRCIVQIHRPVPLAPFGLRDKNRRWLYPTQPGVYGCKLSQQVWLWKEQAIECQKIGITVTPLGGYGWEHMTSNNFHWADKVISLREQADPDLTSLVKRSIVGAIGRQDIAGPRYHMLHSNEEPVPGDKPILRAIDADGDCPLTDLFTRETGYSYGGMCHWAVFTVMRTNLTVYKAARAMRGTLLMINFDGLVFAQECQPREGWQRKPLTNVRIPGPRHIISDQGIRTPGVPH